MLLAMETSAARTTSVDGTEHNLVGDKQVRGHKLREMLFQLSVTAVSGTTPTLDVDIEESLDGTNWFTLTSFTQAVAQTVEIKKTVNVSGYIRATWTIGGTGTPTFTFKIDALIED
jgi:hypothetical protein